ncbi:hypothetical protein SDD30_14025 [Moorella naiadis]|uniref:hypothetical protein n=1 Tax=Moorella naiadis (nom. illeg.) TaxID=3093670 RepID=UPI003D9C94FB
MYLIDVSTSITDFLDLLKSQGRLPRVVHGDLRRTNNFSPEAKETLGLVDGEEIDVSTPLLWWEEKWLTLEDEPACYASIYFNPGTTSIAMVVNLV